MCEVISIAALLSTHSFPCAHTSHTGNTCEPCLSHDRIFPSGEQMQSFIIYQVVALQKVLCSVLCSVLQREGPSWLSTPCQVFKQEPVSGRLYFIPLIKLQLLGPMHACTSQHNLCSAASEDAAFLIVARYFTAMRSI